MGEGVERGTIGLRPWGRPLGTASYIVTILLLSLDEEVNEHCSFQDEEDDCTYRYTLKADPSMPHNNTILVQKKKGEQGVK